MMEKVLYVCVCVSPNVRFGSVAATQRATSPPGARRSPKLIVTSSLRPFPQFRLFCYKTVYQG